MKKLSSFFRNCVRECPFRFRCTIMAMSALLALMIILSLHTGCASTQAGLSREQGLYRVSTNIVTGVQQYVPYLPAPVSDTSKCLTVLTIRHAPNTKGQAEVPTSSSCTHACGAIYFASEWQSFDGSGLTGGLQILPGRSGWSQFLI